MTIFSKRKAISESNILLAGPVRNVATIIEDEALLLRRSLADFNEVFTLIVESDSTDDTTTVLEKMKGSEENFDFVTLGNLSKTYRKRTERIAKARNEVINQVKNNPKYRHIDFIAMADMDGMNPLLSDRKIQQCWSVNEDWDVITANQVEAYYDVWTLRHPDWSPGDCWAQKDRLQDLIGESAAINLAITAKQNPLHPSLGMIEVDSAFGGFGIYKRSAFLAGQYAGLDEYGNEVSDHVPFHRQLRDKNYRIYINCALINCSKYPESQEPAAPPPLKFGLRMVQKLGHATLGKRRFSSYLEKLLSN